MAKCQANMTLGKAMGRLSKLCEAQNFKIITLQGDQRRSISCSGGLGENSRHHGHWSTTVAKAILIICMAHPGHTKFCQEQLGKQEIHLHCRIKQIRAISNRSQQSEMIIHEN